MIRLQFGLSGERPVPWNDLGRVIDDIDQGRNIISQPRRTPPDIAINIREPVEIYLLITCVHHIRFSEVNYRIPIGMRAILKMDHVDLLTIPIKTNIIFKRNVG